MNSQEIINAIIEEAEHLIGDLVCVEEGMKVIVTGNVAIYVFVSIEADDDLTASLRFDEAYLLSEDSGTGAETFTSSQFERKFTVLPDLEVPEEVDALYDTFIHNTEPLD